MPLGILSSLFCANLAPKTLKLLPKNYISMPAYFDLVLTSLATFCLGKQVATGHLTKKVQQSSFLHCVLSLREPSLIVWSGKGKKQEFPIVSYILFQAINYTLQKIPI